MVEMHLYVEGGGDARSLHIECRKGFAEFLAKAGLQGHMPRIVACGGRGDAYDRFCTALRQGKFAMLLVDSEEGKPEEWQPWRHLARREGDEWPHPVGASDTQCHLMVQCMENWFLADPATLQKFFGQGYAANHLPAVENPVETIDKKTVYQALAEATRHCKSKGAYGKGKHAFQLLAMLDPAKVIAAAPWANRFVTSIRKAMGC